MEIAIWYLFEIWNLEIGISYGQKGFLVTEAYRAIVEKAFSE